MTCCTRGEQLFAWQTYPATINVTNEIGFHPTRATLFHSSMVQSLDVLRPTVGVVDDDAQSIEAQEWNVCCTIPYPTVSVNGVFRNTCSLSCIVDLPTEPVWRR
ncbi:hypothetical protein AVEN_124969-1 [Araneus ventricosus]|uniref:Uncharacterized protein n=1 Tax=Araneus ventricosus TaxID=182803 RepID=A0A4Y2X7E7_ARAVE|nr:hypothetical protein AVEN_124969-1 [Araneus ventricosus]